MVETWQTHEFGPPERAGVYCVLSVNQTTGKRSVLYVGSSRNISKRILALSHPYRILFNEAPEDEWIISKSKICSNYVQLEKRLIKRLQPKYNIIHKSNSLT